MPRSPRLLALTAALALLACAPPKAGAPYPTAEPPLGEVKPEGSVRYFERAIELAPLLRGFPYERFEASLARDRLFFLETGEGYALKMLDLAAGAGPLDLAAARTISDVDWSTRSLWGVHLPKAGETLWLHADARNDERMNLWTLDLASQALKQVTDHDYVYGFGFSADEATIAYLPRSGEKAPFRACLRLLDVASGAGREVLCDTPELTFTWSSPRFSPDGREVYFNALVAGDRKRKQLVAVDLGDGSKRPELRRITDESGRSTLQALRGWVDGRALVFIADDDGYANLYTYDRIGRDVRRITRMREDVRAAAVLDAGVFAVSGTPAGSTLSLVDPKSGKIVGQDRRRGRVDLVEGEGARALWTQEAPDLRFEANLATFTPASEGGAEDIDTDRALDRLGRVHRVREASRGAAPGSAEGAGAVGLATRSLVTLGPALADALVRCRAEAVKIPTFDVDPATGRKRELHAFILHPRAPIAAPSQRLALIRAFYGGDNRYSVFDQVMCAAGLTVISPAVRGSAGFGRDFAALNDRDLGGAEIRDLFEVARWAAGMLGLEPWQIGVYGGSHGGYATMRALTFPAGPERFPLGFGVAMAGFSDILTFFAATNIPDWVILESGDPAKPADAAVMRERSPLTHVASLEAPLLLIHGESDARVPVAESRQMAAKAKELGRPVTYLEFAGQGHHIEGLSRQAALYQGVFDLLSGVVRAQSAASLGTGE